jgi:hypothetical protein
MTRRVQERLILTTLLSAGAIVFFLGITWGVPSRRIDPYLFGSADKAWSGAEIVAAGGPWKPDPNRAADAAQGPAADRSKIVWLNQTREQQAKITERYRLYSCQPDEMVTFRALSGMHGGNFDPRMYQYGGLWIYPVGALLKVASIAGIVEVTPNFQTYLDRPEAFARFYIVARAYSAFWGLLGIIAVFHLAKRFSDRPIVPAAAAAACFLLMPVIINGAHEAKPHLAGAVLTLFAVLAATKYAETGIRKWWMITGILCGLAAGMVLSAAVALVVIPLMTLLRALSWNDRAKITAAAGGLALFVYCITNPYVPINLIRNPAVLKQNLSALSQAKAIIGKESDIGAIQNARRLIIEGASMVGGVTGIIGLLFMIVNHSWWRNVRWRNATLLLGVPAALILIRFTMLAGGKQGEFGRFFILPDVALVILAVVVASNIGWGKKIEAVILGLLVMIAGFQGLAYQAGFLQDARGDSSSRMIAAQRIAALWNSGARTLAVHADVAPYCLPPVDVTGWKILLLPEGGLVMHDKDWPDLLVSPVDEIGIEGDVEGTPYRRIFVTGNWPWIKTRISWADKPFEILIKRAMIAPAKP